MTAEKAIERKQNSIRAYALIKHDKDEADLHHHMVLRTNSSWTCPAIAKWFADDSGQNTFAQIVRDLTGIVDYLTRCTNKNAKPREWERYRVNYTKYKFCIIDGVQNSREEGFGRMLYLLRYFLNKL